MPATTSIPLPDASPRRGRLATAMGSLTPRMLGVIALLLLARAVAGPMEMYDELVPILQSTGWGMLQLVLMVAPIVLAVIVAHELAPPSGASRWIAIGSAVSISPGVGVLLRLFARDVTGVGPRWSSFAAFAGQVWPRYALLAAVLALGLEVRHRQLASIEATRRAEVDREALERELAETRLLLLRAQVEPHFLFNTLATVRRLGDTDPQRAQAMLDSLARYLEVALPGLRSATSTLRRECDLASAYLEVQQVRMPNRLAFDFDVAPELLDREVPPLMLLTLVENAVKHGLQPSSRGGRVCVRAAPDGSSLVLTVADTGVGFAPGSGTGTGLANIRSRLAAEFGLQASLSIGNNDLGGVSATLQLPLK